MHIVYVDDSRDERACVFSALSIPAETWREAFESVKAFRRTLKRSDGIYVYKELHAWKFISGRGRVGDRVVPKGRRRQIFFDSLRLAASLPGAKLFNAVFGPKDDVRAFERLLNRINRTAQARAEHQGYGGHVLVICDQGKEAAYTRLVRKMGVYNPIPSQLGEWPEGTLTRNIPIERILEDPVFKASERSYFIQLADFCAYALLRREQPLPSKSQFGIDQAFGLLSAILAREATQYDPEGILRP